MRWPWAKDEGAASEPEENEEMGRGYTGEAWDDEQDEGLEGEAPEEQDELAELDEDTRAIVAAREAKAAAAQQAAIREALRERGFDLNADGVPLIADPERAAAFTGTLRSAPAPAAPPAPTADAAPAEEPEPDIYSDPEGWKAWNRAQVRREAEAIFDARMAQIAPRLEQTEQFQLSVAEERALGRVLDLLPDSPGTDVRQLGAREHRARFQEAFLHHYRALPPQQRAQLSDEDLETIAAATIPKVLPRQKPQRDDRGRYATAQSVNARLYGESWQGHPDGARAPRRPEASDEERAAMKRYNMTEKELAALSGPAASLSDYRSAQGKKK